MTYSVNMPVGSLWVEGGAQLGIEIGLRFSLNKNQNLPSDP